ncbi:bifunctional [glutamine synthetase] adenylyltransferase/[glutamine synthetase]-adenylyl-L-tyrosine phosphorylase [Rothia koreensis]|uniref:bifunctional [glutamine synthetase] adenylyltransferase/[glutamine synthetase]-adenylyl-L-tyrosine phosphorylase n=1 Tax=Rothia koreensis TaxID=592378 RepID=UPI003FCDD6D8
MVAQESSKDHAGPEAKRRLAAVGFSDLGGANRWLDSPELEGIDKAALFDGLTLSPSPDLALKAIVRMLTDSPELRKYVERGREAAGLFRVLGASEALGEFLMRHPEHLRLFDGEPRPLPDPSDTDLADEYRDKLLGAVGADAASPQPVATMTGDDAKLAVRTSYREHLTRIALADLMSDDPVEDLPKVGAALADLAGAALDAALAVARAEVSEEEPATASVDLAVIAMGKCGARELNYISDVDVVYAVGPAPVEVRGDLDEPDERAMGRIGTELVKAMTKVVHGVGPEPGLWEVDPNLRPEGKDGPLVRTVQSHRVYYERWAENWEFQALLKARPVAGSRPLGEEYIEAIWPFVWDASGRPHFVDSVQSMRHRVTDNIPDDERDRQIKLGPGGLRDVEFTVQLLQLVHGRTDDCVRERSTTQALAALRDRSYVGRDASSSLDHEYRWQRTLEHRVQLLRLRRTHLMPVKESEQAAVARGMRGLGDRARVTPEDLLKQRRRSQRTVRGLHERLFFRPLLAAVSKLSADEVALTPEAAQDRLAALGYLDPKGAMRHIEAMTKGLSRRAEIQRTILPVLLGWFAQGVDPDAGLLGFRRVSESLGQTQWYLRMLRDSPAAAERLCAVLSSSRFVMDLLEDEPESISWLDRDERLRPETFETLWAEIRSKISRHSDAMSAIRMIRLIRRREILRTALGETAGVTDLDDVMKGLSDADQATILGALHTAERELYQEKGEEVLTDVAVIGMGRQGGAEIGYGSDADVMYVHQPREGADEGQAVAQANALISRTTQLLKIPMKPAIRAEKALEIDADLRPEGKSGPMVRTLDSYAEYYARWADTWEYQALLRARPLAGSAEVADKFIRLIDPYRYPANFSEDQLRQIRRMKARVEAERMPRGADPDRQVKLGRGGLSDVEWLVQVIQLEHAHEHPELKTTSTLRALQAAVDVGIVDAEDAAILESAWRLATRIRGANVLRHGRASDSLPSSRKDLEATARWSGYGSGNAANLEEDYLRLTRRARSVVEKLFYGHME